MALALEAAARSDDFFVSRQLYPNVDFFSGKACCNCSDWSCCVVWCGGRGPVECGTGAGAGAGALNGPPHHHACIRTRSATLFLPPAAPSTPVPPTLPPLLSPSTGLVYRAMGFPPQFFTVLFAIPRITGYLAHWRETLGDPDTKIVRPQQDYRVRCAG